MPAQYAHYRFGREALPALPGEARQIIQRFRRLYDMGQQGPDIFFYHNPLWKTPAGGLGHSFHGQSGQEFFSRVPADSEGARAYLFGLLGHYCLDSMCHPFVNKMDESGEAAHVALEKEFDRYLMAADGLAQPHTQNLSGRIRLTRGECVTVSGFYPPATAGNVNQSVRHMRWALAFLSSQKRDKHEKLVKRVKPGLLEHFIPTEPIASFARMDSELLARYNRAMKAYPGLAQQLLDHMHTGADLGEDFLPRFG